MFVGREVSGSSIVGRIVCGGVAPGSRAGLGPLGYEEWALLCRAGG